VPTDIDRGLALVRMSDDARPPTAGEPLSGRSLLSARGEVSVLAGGLDYVDPLPRDSKFCSGTRRDGIPCQAFATRTGLCVGHSRTRSDGE